MSEQNPIKHLSYLNTLAADHPEILNNPELNALWKTQHHYAVSPTLIVHASLEEHYYKLNNLPAQLSRLFKHVNLQNPDEDDIEELEPVALALFKKHFLLDEDIDKFYEALQTLGNKVCLRSPSKKGKSFSKGRPTLIALKEHWASNWTFNAIMDRLENNQSIAVEASPVLIQAVSTGEPIVNQGVNTFLAKEVKLYLDVNNHITQIESLVG